MLKFIKSFTLFFWTAALKKQFSVPASQWYKPEVLFTENDEHALAERKAIWRTTKRNRWVIFTYSCICISGATNSR